MSPEGLQARMSSAEELQAIEQQVFTAALEKIAQRCRYDLYYLAKHILDYELMEPHVHEDLCAYTMPLLPNIPPEYEDRMPKETGETNGLEDQFIRNRRQSLFLMPRGTFKTSVVTIGFALQYVLNDPDCRILLDSETFGKSKAFLTEIKGHLEGNDKYREVFKAIHGVYPDERKKSDLWTDSQVVLSCRKRTRKEPTFSCAGIDVTKNGMHYDLIICDDLHSEKNVTTKDQINQVIDHYRLAFSLLDPGMSMIVIGTRWDYNDLYQFILDNERHRFNILIRKAIRDDGSLLFPERLTKDFLESTRATQGSSIFSKQYQNEPIDDETATFKRSNIVRKPWAEVKDRPINWYLCADPSYEGEYSDFAAIALVGMDFQRDLYVRHITRAKMTYSTFINELFNLYNKFQPKSIILETIGTKTLTHSLTNEQKVRGTWLRIHEIRHRSNSKEERIRALAPYYEFGHIFHIKECPQIDELEYELLHFPRGKHDDVVDAVANVLEYATPPNPGKFNQTDTSADKKRVLYKPRSPITGV